MKRGYTALEFKEKLRRLRAVRPDIAVSTDIIVGFPGETDRDFEATLKLVREANFDQSFTFIYSQRPGTPAASLPDDVTHEVKQQRLARLQEQLNAQARAISEQMVGSTQTRAGRAPFEERRRGARGPHGKWPLGEFRRTLEPHWPFRRRGHRRSAPAIAARSPGECGACARTARRGPLLN